VVRGGKFEIEATDQDHSYSVFWTLRLVVQDSKGNPVGDTDVSILDRNKKVALTAKTDALGNLQAELPEYAVEGKGRTLSSPYTIVIGKVEKEMVLESNQTIYITVN
jgi:uncharacterized protein YfaS (alpha-2-macroglobulin family)